MKKTTEFLRLTFRNDFHNTEVNVRAIVREDNRLLISKWQSARISRELCGMKDCQCGTIRGKKAITDDVGNIYSWAERYPASDGSELLEIVWTPEDDKRF